MEGTDFLSVVGLSQSRDPGFVVALDTDGDVEWSTKQVRGLHCRERVWDTTPRFFTHLSHPLHQWGCVCKFLSGLWSQFRLSCATVSDHACCDIHLHGSQNNSLEKHRTLMLMLMLMLMSMLMSLSMSMSMSMLVLVCWEWQNFLLNIETRMKVKVDDVNIKVKLNVTFDVDV